MSFATHVNFRDLENRLRATLGRTRAPPRLTPASSIRMARNGSKRTPDKASREARPTSVTYYVSDAPTCLNRMHCRVRRCRLVHRVEPAPRFIVTSARVTCCQAHEPQTVRIERLKRRTLYLRYDVARWRSYSIHARTDEWVSRRNCDSVRSNPTKITRLLAQPINERRLACFPTTQDNERATPGWVPHSNGMREIAIQCREQTFECPAKNCLR